MVDSSKEARFESPLSSCMIHISAMMGPSVVLRERLGSCSEVGPDADCNRGGKERSRAYCPLIVIFSLSMRK
jgi:hypothetical protein